MTIFDDGMLRRESQRLTQDLIDKARGSSYIVCMRACLTLSGDIFKKFIRQDPSDDKFKRDLLATWLEMIMISIEAEWLERYKKDFYSEDYNHDREKL